MKRELYITNNYPEFCRIRDVLALHRIKYSVRIIDPTRPDYGRWSRRVSNSFGINLDSVKMYYVYVPSKDYDEARYITGV